MRTHYWYPQTENDTRRLMNFFGMVKDKVTSNDIYRRELIIHLLRYLYLELFNAYEKEASLMTTRKDTRKEELANKFFGLIMKHFKENKDVAFYADKLCITSKYLTMVIKEVSGKSAKDWIVEYIVLEIKALLKNTNMNIQEIAVCSVRFQAPYGSARNITASTSASTARRTPERPTCSACWAGGPPCRSSRSIS